VLLKQHAQIREFFAAIKAANGDAKQEPFDQLRLLLAQYETAEEMGPRRARLVATRRPATAKRTKRPVCWPSWRSWTRLPHSSRRC